MTTPAYSAKVYHCLQANGTKAFQGRPCEKGKKTVAVTEQKNSQKASSANQNGIDPADKSSILGKWTLNGISSNLSGEIQTQDEKIAWAFFDNDKVTYQYDDTSTIYDYTFNGKVISMPDSPVSSFEIIKSEGTSAVWKTGTTYYFLTLSSVN